MTTDDKALGDGLPLADHRENYDEETMTNVSRKPAIAPTRRILAIDVGAGTQDILIYEADKPYENAIKLVLPSQTQIVGRRIRDVTKAGAPLHLAGTIMGGGASSDSVKDHLAAGLRVSATPSAARTMHNDPARVEALGITIRDDAPPGAWVVELADVDSAGLRAGLERFGVELPEVAAIAVQDHGFRPGSGNNEVRFEYLQSLIADGGRLEDMVFAAPPEGMTRMAGVQESWPGAWLMDTGTAAVMGSLGDPKVAEAADGAGAILVNVGNMHTFATLVRRGRLYGLFEHHTGGIDAATIARLVNGLRDATLDPSTFRERFDGHGAAFDEAYREQEPFQFVAITGPNRGIARDLDYHEAAPHGDMMLTGSFGLVDAVLAKTRLST
jgi:uncharacterized protein (DUF1786 family)